MGMFDKIKQNLTHGGIDVKVDAPPSVHETSAGFTATVTITNKTDEAKTIKKVTASLRKEKFGNDDGSRPPLSSTTDDKGLVLAPGETKSVDLEVGLNVGKALKEAADKIPALRDNEALNTAANILGKLQNVGESMGQPDITNQWSYFVRADVDVEGIALDPSDRIEIQVLRPGEFGTAVRI